MKTMNNEANFDAIKIGVASPDEILSWSYGEVTKPETINYRTQRPEKDGLFSERIFGPTKDWECYCGKYKKIRYKGVICDKCGVEVTRSIVRRERMGHIKLATPVVHPWFLRSVPSKIGLALDETLSKLERVTYYAAYIVTAVDDAKRKEALDEIKREFKRIKSENSEKAEEIEAAAERSTSLLKSLKVGIVLDDYDFEALKKFSHVFSVNSGGEGIRQALGKLDLKKEIDEIETEVSQAKDGLRKRKLLRRLKFFRLLEKNNGRPEWMVMTTLPVLPPDLRPMVALDGGRYATSDLNDLYRRVINRNNRLKKLLELKAPDVIVVNERRMLQEAVDALIDSSIHGNAKVTGAGRRPLRSLADMLRGKQGRFRQNLLGKRVDYSGRSVIVVGPSLKLDQCGLPKKMALEIFKPFVISGIMQRGLAHNIKTANKLIEQGDPEVWEILEEVIRERRVLLNRAPTLHRLSVQAFKPILVEGLAIHVHPMVCTAFNADFDGDQMAVHLPLSSEAQAECDNIMLSTINLLKPASGEAVVSPTKDMVLGCYYLTKDFPGAKGSDKIFADAEEAEIAYENGVIDLHAPIKVGTLETTCGRLIFNKALPAGTPFVNETVGKSVLQKLTSGLTYINGPEVMQKTLDDIKALGFAYSTTSGISWGMDDLVVPKEKADILEEADKKSALIEEQYQSGLLTNEERRVRIIEVWSNAVAGIKKIVPKALKEDSSVYMIIDSGARGSWQQPTQMMGMKGLVVNPKGEEIELPIRTSLKEGHSGLTYFTTTHGSRKGLADTALKTAEAGYLTRRLVDVAQDVVIREEDCKTKEGIVIHRSDGNEFGHKFSDRLFSRTSLNDVKIGRKTIVKAGEVIGPEAAREIEASDIEEVEVRSPIACKTLYGVCAKCYGLDLGDHQPVQIGEAVGIIAAQSIGEPGTQLTLNTKHAGGAAGKDITTGLPRVEELFEVHTPKGKAILAPAGGSISDIEEKGINKAIHFVPHKGKPLSFLINRRIAVLPKEEEIVEAGDSLTEGSIDLKELMELKGKEAVYRYLIREVQRIYVSEGNSINNKHIEVIVRQMFGRVKVVASGDTDFVAGDVVDKSRFREINKMVKSADKEPAKAEEILLGTTKSALAADSWLSAASFQETARVLTNAAVESRIDQLRGLKENVIIGRLLPLGKESESSLEKVNEEVEEKSQVLAE
ncbi:MAG: DNA-directed RNA polymerase subunit beta' [Patescibacteria group bacterium]|nr:DNA-directed RNA polymerase subunit beta' [Patescibacteria group bacterium]